MTYLAVVVLVGALMLGIPIPFALASAGMLGVWIVTGDLTQMMGILGTSVYSTVAEYNLTTIPMFILMAYFASHSGVAKELYFAISNWMSHIRGGLAVATVFATAIFGALSGASVAAAAVMSQIAMPNMRKFGYSEELAAGAIAVGATTDILIPPSVAMVVYGVMTGTSIGDLLIAGVLPGILLAVMLAVTVLVWVRINPAIAPQTYRVSWSERFVSLHGIWPSLTLIIGILVLLYTGVATPTEVGALGALATAILAVAMRRLTWAKAMISVRQTLRSTAMIFSILIGAHVFGYYLTLSRVPHDLISAVTGMDLNRWVVILLIIIAYFVISMFMDELPLMIIVLPLTFPLVISLGFDPVWYGVVTMLMVAMGLVFPPVGMVAFVVSFCAQVDLAKVYKGTSVLIIAIFLTTGLVMVFPEIATWLPRTMRH